MLIIYHLIRFVQSDGCEHVLQNEEIKERVKRTNLERYGCENVSQIEETQEKIH
jgi:hypothetical protein